jgi:hypothetical protein
VKTESRISTDWPTKDRPITVAVSPNELAWLEFLRLLMEDDVPAPSLARIQALRRALSSRKSD